MSKKDLVSLQEATKGITAANSEEALKVAVPYWCEKLSEKVVQSVFDEAGAKIDVKDYLPHTQKK